MNVDNVISELLDSEIPAIRYKLRVNVLGEDPLSQAICELQAEVKKSTLVASLLQGRDAAGCITQPKSPYAKWQGAHWVMAILADIGYPQGDADLMPIRDQLQESWLAEKFYTEFEAASKAAAYRSRGVPVMEGRHRRCASQQANTLWSILRLGLTNKRTHEFVERLFHWQWPDGGWNCDTGTMTSSRDSRSWPKQDS